MLRIRWSTNNSVERIDLTFFVSSFEEGGGGREIVPLFPRLDEFPPTSPIKVSRFDQISKPKRVLLYSRRGHLLYLTYLFVSISSFHRLYRDSRFVFLHVSSHLFKSPRDKDRPRSIHRFEVFENTNLLSFFPSLFFFFFKSNENILSQVDRSKKKNRDKIIPSFIIFTARRVYSSPVITTSRRFVVRTFENS